MNKNEVAQKLIKRGIPFVFHWEKERGLSLQLVGVTDEHGLCWNILLPPMDDNNVRRFVNCVEANYRCLLAHYMKGGIAAKRSVN